MYVNESNFETQYPEEQRKLACTNMLKDFQKHGIGHILDPDLEKRTLDILYLATYGGEIDVTNKTIGREVWRQAIEYYQINGEKLKLVQLEARLYDLTKSTFRKEFLEFSAAFLGVSHKWIAGMALFIGGDVYACEICADIQKWAYHKNAKKLFPNEYRDRTL